MEDFKEQADGVRHIPSNYSKEMATKSSVVSFNAQYYFSISLSFKQRTHFAANTRATNY